MEFIGKIKKKIGIGLVLFIAAIPVFINLGHHPMMLWDESRYAAGSYEMMKNKNPFVVTYQRRSDNMSAKPPLLHWLQSASIAVFGFTEFSTRLPSALACLALFILVIYFARTYFASWTPGIITVLVLVTTPEGITGIDHSFRTADYDGLLTLFSFCGAAFMFLYCERPEASKYLVASICFFTLGILTKAAAGLFYLPGIFIYLLVARKLSLLLKNKLLYIYGIASLLLIAGIFLAREHYTPGYLRTLNEMELFGRMNAVQDGHEEPWWFYFDHLLNVGFGNWAVFIPFGWVAALFLKDERVRRISLFSFIISAAFYLLLITSKSKLAWYELPIYPLLALQVALFIRFVLEWLTQLVRFRNERSRHVLLAFLVACIFVLPYKDSFCNSLGKEFNEGYKTYNNVQYYLQPMPEVTRSGVLLATETDKQQYLFYFYKLNDAGYSLKMETAVRPYSAGEKLIVNDTLAQKLLEEKYQLNVLDRCRQLKVYLVKGEK